MKRISTQELDETIKSMFNKQIDYLTYSPVLKAFIEKISGNFVDKDYTYSVEYIVEHMSVITQTWKNVRFNADDLTNIVNIWKDDDLVGQIRYVSEDNKIHGHYILHWLDNKLEDFVFNNEKGHDLDAAYLLILHKLCLGI